MSVEAGRQGRDGLHLSRFATWDVAIIVVTVVFLIFAVTSVQHFGTSQNATFLVLELAPILLLALPMTLIIVTGEIDLSVASTVGLTSSAMGVMWNSGVPLETIMPLCVVIGAVLGAVNGFFVTALGLPSLAVTIGTLALYRGLAFVLLGDTAVADFPRSHSSWTIGTIGETPIPNVLVPMIVLAGLFAAVLHAMPVGRAIFASGSNRVAAAFAGIPVAKLKFWLYVTSGAVAGLVGVFWTLRFSSARADNAHGLELTVVAAVLLGGVSIFGGKGTLPGVLAGVVLLSSLQNALRLANVSSEALTVVTGSLLIISVLAPNILGRVRGVLRRRLRRTHVPAPNP
ncbi:ABC transporter permease [Actinobacteria bacterium YIM 96077]|uniref:Autoinducer 2 import system permease protein LsrD n=1 Tax=Phytoactinopolyspora halophila TaxID=1981511 RepID=A0A329QL93_9ACTN|nr:ABC transporter permease [Phytoactinopolyspora halophila]AYY12618.1 ABC transporter permease [Actinobacteria bacterium YIM 96077]RAW12479.1 ABC transporter permease [Phytoactinopolyspora halophila]